MRRLAVDAGMSRIGVAVSEGSLALPLSSVANSASAHLEVLRIAEEKTVDAIYVGLPLSLSGSITASSKMAVEFARRLASASEIPIRLIDERLTTKSALSRLREAGRNAKSSKELVDAQSAALILEFALQSERENRLAGKSLEDLDDSGN